MKAKLSLIDWRTRRVVATDDVDVNPLWTDDHALTLAAVALATRNGLTDGSYRACVADKVPVTEAEIAEAMDGKPCMQAVVGTQAIAESN
jgi:hypothetical protein